MSQSIAGKVAIIGVGSTKFGELFEQTYNDLVVEATFQAYDDAGITGNDIDAAWLGCFLPLGWGYDGTGGPALAESLNLYPKPVSRVSNYCTTGMEAVRNAAFGVASGMYDCVLAVGAEKMREVPPRGSLVAQHVEKLHPLFGKGRTAPGSFAILATRYFEEFGAGKEDLAEVAVKNHYHGSLNPKAHFRKEITIEQVMKAPPVTEPLGLYDCCPTTDGAAAVILCRADIAEKRFGKKDYVLIDGMGLSCANGYINTQFDPKFSFLGFEATTEASRQAYEQAGITNPLEEIDVAEVHDCFTITEILNYEDLGFVKKGEGPDFVKSGASRLGGELPVNTSGGLKSCGHPIGATGARVIANLSEQLLDRCGERQVKGAKRALGHTLGGPGSVSSVFVLSKN
ncbi:MAG: acetyl-CoA acetyltransferase [Nitrospinaceae bacterium]|jgi:acetyl-CoA C-acetyltransferase|nr:acetyl-CoA acetyltransferase [Nitrospinaceae bacterium]MBT3434388.1 acetyl-CoA acetyltransferase [Nitrospinaceae bacterium]MBT4431001.1 acetyl-CoA acetyltransferase [Nitrospinaceae bacterium]MBT5366667.1 acetyl-CoA acetyltransferase [Nitrospinaceae bacterium]MBT5949118.1 acetyl-CoA acetyltransferase [Nitrospinaceae bacterium]